MKEIYDSFISSLKVGLNMFLTPQNRVIIAFILEEGPIVIIFRRGTEI